ncbi:MAG: hypothetical protein OER86_12610 [Phycisphaerae bacterium]|nr:hypothetical protein [Phycisphaerae bacterium]
MTFRPTLFATAKWTEDRDLGSWALLLAGAGLLALAVLLPARQAMLQRQAVRDRLEWTAAALEIRRANYEAFLRAARRAEPLLVQRLAWQHLHVKPVGARLLTPGPGDSTWATVGVDQWVRPAALPPPPAGPAAAAPSRLQRLLTGDSRMWVVGFGGWMILCGLLLNRSD